jgi:hypothetical protein
MTGGGPVDAVDRPAVARGFGRGGIDRGRATPVVPDFEASRCDFERSMSAPHAPEKPIQDRSGSCPVNTEPTHIGQTVSSSQMGRALSNCLLAQNRLVTPEPGKTRM